jgi:hypothetical protein
MLNKLRAREYPGQWSCKDGEVVAVFKSLSNGLWRSTSGKRGRITGLHRIVCTDVWEGTLYAFSCPDKKLIALGTVNPRQGPSFDQQVEVAAIMNITRAVQWRSLFNNMHPDADPRSKCLFVEGFTARPERHHGTKQNFMECVKLKRSEHRSNNLFWCVLVLKRHVSMYVCHFL